MQTVTASDYRVRDWPRHEHRRLPFSFHPVEIGLAPDDVSPPVRDPGFIAWRLSAHYLLEPIWPHLATLEPGDVESLQGFVIRLGLDELVAWGISPERTSRVQEVWRPIQGLTSRERSLPHRIPIDHLARAWQDEIVQLAVAQELESIRKAMTLAAEAEGADEALDTLWNRSPHLLLGGVDLVPEPVSPIDDTPALLTIVETPRHIFDRARLELVDHLLGDGLPKFCTGCGVAFIGARTDQEYHNTECRRRAYGRQHNRTDRRRAYQKMYGRLRRGQITEDQFETWCQKNNFQRRRRR
jgi:hypothetical protein